MQFVFPDLFFFKKCRWCEQPLQSPYCNWGTGEAGARKDAQHSKLAENAVTKGLDLNKKEHGTSIREVIQHLDYFFFSFLRFRQLRKATGSKTTTYISNANTNRFRGEGGKLRDSILTSGWVSSHYIFVSLLKINHSSSKKAGED